MAQYTRTQFWLSFSRFASCLSLLIFVFHLYILGTGQLITYSFVCILWLVPFTLSSYRAFPVTSARVWNSQPDLVTSAPSVAVFRSRLKTHLFNISYPSPLWLYSACAVTLSCFGHCNHSSLLTYLLTDSAWPNQYHVYFQHVQTISVYTYFNYPADWLQCHLIVVTMIIGIMGMWALYAGRLAGCIAD